MLCGREGNRIGLASHWPCVTDFSGLSTYGLNGHGKGDEHPTYAPYWGMVHFTFTFKCHSVALAVMLVLEL